MQLVHVKYLIHCVLSVISYSVHCVLNVISLGAPSYGWKNVNCSLLINSLTIEHKSVRGFGEFGGGRRRYGRDTREGCDCGQDRLT